MTEVFTNVSYEESAVSPHMGLIFIYWTLVMPGQSSLCGLGLIIVVAYSESVHVD